MDLKTLAMTAGVVVGVMLILESAKKRGYDVLAYAP